MQIKNINTWLHAEIRKNKHQQCWFLESNFPRVKKIVQEIEGLIFQGQNNNITVR